MEGAETVDENWLIHTKASPSLVSKGCSQVIDQFSRVCLRFFANGSNGVRESMESAFPLDGAVI